MTSKFTPIRILFAFACLVSPLISEQLMLRLSNSAVLKELDATALKALPRSEVKTTGRDGKEKTYHGVELAELLRLTGAPAGATLRGKEMTRVLLVTASDGYQVVFSLTELDASFRKDHFLLADDADGEKLDAFEGPLMIVVPGDLKHGRWIRQVKKLDLVTVMEPAAISPGK